MEGAINLVGGDVEEAEGNALRLGERFPEGAGGLEEVESPEDVGLQEGFGAINGAVHVGLGGKVDDGGEAVLGEEGGEEGGVVDVAVDEAVPRVAGEVCEGGGVAGVGELVEVENGEVRSGFKQVTDEVGADEAGAAGEQEVIPAPSSAGRSRRPRGPRSCGCRRWRVCPRP